MTEAVATRNGFGSVDVESIHFMKRNRNVQMEIRK